MNFIRIFIIIFLTTVVCLAGFFASMPKVHAATSSAAVSVGVCPDGSTNCSSTKYAWSCPANSTDATCKSYIQAIYAYSIRLGSVLAILMIIYAGFLYSMSEGDTTKTGSAKEILLGAILGLILLILIGVILDYIGLPPLS